MFAVRGGRDADSYEYTAGGWYVGADDSVGPHRKCRCYQQGGQGRPPLQDDPQVSLAADSPFAQGGKGWRKEEQKMRLREQSHFLSYSGDNQSSNTG